MSPFAFFSQRFTVIGNIYDQDLLLSLCQKLIELLPEVVKLQNGIFVMMASLIARIRSKLLRTRRITKLPGRVGTPLMEDEKFFSFLFKNRFKATQKFQITGGLFILKLRIYVFQRPERVERRMTDVWSNIAKLLPRLC